jgi:hypothetical protein
MQLPSCWTQRNPTRAINFKFITKRQKSSSRLKSHNFHNSVTSNVILHRRSIAGLNGLIINSGHLVSELPVVPSQLLPESGSFYGWTVAWSVLLLFPREDIQYTKYGCIYSICCPYFDFLCGLVIRVSGYRSKGPGFDSLQVWGLERGPLSLVRTIEELLE